MFPLRQVPGEKKDECDITQPVAVMYDQGKLYIGENGRITIKQGRQASFVRPPNLIWSLSA